VSVVATIGYSAFFVGPPLIGFLAHEVGYRAALLVIAVPVVLGLLVVGAARPLPTAAGAERPDAGPADAQPADAEPADAGPADAQPTGAGLTAPEPADVQRADADAAGEGASAGDRPN